MYTHHATQNKPIAPSITDQIYVIPIIPIMPVDITDNNYILSLYTYIYIYIYIYHIQFCFLIIVVTIITTSTIILSKIIIVPQIAGKL